MTRDTFQLAVRDSQGGLNYIYDVTGPGAKPVLRMRQNYEPRGRAWYVSAVSRQHENWSPVFSDFRSKALAIALSKPIYSTNHDLLGVATSSIFLNDLSEFLRSLTIGQNGVAFIMEPDGTLIASSNKEPIFWYAGEQ